MTEITDNKLNSFLIDLKYNIYNSLNLNAFNFADIYLPPDKILNSTIGISNGNYVKEILNRCFYDSLN